MTATLTRLSERFDAFVPTYANYMKTCIASVHLSLTQLNALRAVDQDQPVTMAEIAKALRLTPYAVTKIVDVLERDALVERKPHPTDRRALHVVLTQVGREVLDAGLSQRRSALNELLGVLNERDQEVFISILSQLSSKIDGE